MIRVEYQGTLGNQLWQYSVGRIMAEDLGLRFKCPPIPGFPRTRDEVSGRTMFWPRMKLSGHCLPEQMRPSRITMKGYFQRFEHIRERAEVMEWCRTSHRTRLKSAENDLVLSIRRGWNGWPTELCPDVEYYQSLLAELDFAKLWVCTDSPDDPFFSFLPTLGIDYEVVRGSALDQFAFIQESSRVVMAPSTFTFWATYAGNAKEVYWPKIPGLESTADRQDWYPVGDPRFKEVP